MSSYPGIKNSIQIRNKYNYRWLLFYLISLWFFKRSTMVYNFHTGILSFSAISIKECLPSDQVRKSKSNFEFFSTNILPKFAYKPLLPSCGSPSTIDLG